MTARREPSATDLANFVALFGKVPTVVVEQRQWDTDEGRAFMEALHRYLRKGGQVKPLGEALGLPMGTLPRAIEGDRRRRARDRKAGRHG